MKKLNAVNVLIDSATGEAKSLKELNALGRRKPNLEEVCDLNKASSKSNIIDIICTTNFDIVNTRVYKTHFFFYVSIIKLY